MPLYPTANRIFKTQFMGMGMTEPEFETFWTIVEEACEITPWSALTTFEDVSAAFRELWRPDDTIANALTALDTWADTHGLKPVTP